MDILTAHKDNSKDSILDLFYCLPVDFNLAYVKGLIYLLPDSVRDCIDSVLTTTFEPVCGELCGAGNPGNQTITTSYDFIEVSNSDYIAINEHPNSMTPISQYDRYSIPLAAHSLVDADADTVNNNNISFRRYRNPVVIRKNLSVVAVNIIENQIWRLIRYLANVTDWGKLIVVKSLVNIFEFIDTHSNSILALSGVTVLFNRMLLLWLNGEDLRYFPQISMNKRDIRIENSLKLLLSPFKLYFSPIVTSNIQSIAVRAVEMSTSLVEISSTSLFVFCSLRRIFKCNQRITKSLKIISQSISSCVWLINRSILRLCDNGNASVLGTGSIWVSICIFSIIMTFMVARRYKLDFNRLDWLQRIIWRSLVKILFNDK